MYVLFLISIFLFRIPNFYIFPFIRSAFLTTQAVARVLSILVLLWNVYSYFKYKNKSSIISPSLTLNLILLFLFVESASIVSAINIDAFIQRYKDVLIGVSFFINGYVYKKKIYEIFLILLIPLPINIIYEIFMYFFPQSFIKFGSFLIYDKHFNLVLFNISRGRTYIEAFNEISLPFLFFYINKNKVSRYIKIISFILVILILSCAYMSSWRIRVVMALFGCIISMIFFQRKNFTIILVMIFSIFFLGFFINYLSLRSTNVSFVSRFIDEDPINGVNKTIDFRLGQIYNASELSKKSLLGVGLGNYFDNLSSNSKKYINLQKFDESKTALEFVHNSFGSAMAELGMVGLVVYIILILRFAISDLYRLLSKNELFKVPILAFWTLFIFGLFNPINIGSYQVFFLMLRAFLL